MTEEETNQACLLGLFCLPREHSFAQRLVELSGIRILRGERIHGWLGWELHKSSSSCGWKCEEFWLL